MELYTLTSRFLPRESISEFTSVIWTERYSAAGDVQLVVPAIPSRIEQLVPGTLLGLRGTKEIMMLETQSIDKGLLTVTGSSLLKYLNERQAIWFDQTYDDPDTTTGVFTEDPKKPKAGEYATDTTSGQLISVLVDRMVINPVPFGSYWASINLDWTNDKIPGLSLGLVDANGPVRRYSIPVGPLYDGIQSLAAQEALGLKLYLNSASYTGGYVLKFATYRGKDRTKAQTVNPLMRLAPQMDSLFDSKEVSSNASYKNVIYVAYKNTVTTHYIPGLPVPTGFARRVLYVDAPDIYLDPPHIPPFREQVARDTIANHYYIQMVDGQVSTQIEYKFGENYGLGDVVELEGFSGLISKARVTEYIRAQDQYGEKAYPTLSVLDPLAPYYPSDVEPEWYDDPYYDLDDLSDLDHKTKPKHPKDPKDPNPDPTPNYTPPPEPSIVPSPTDSRFIVVGYYPNQDMGQVIGYATFDGKLTKAWRYEPEDNTVEDINNTWTDLYPLGRTLDRKYVIVMSEESKDSTDEYDWSYGYAYWLFHTPTGEVTKLTDTIPRYLQGDNPISGIHVYEVPGTFWCGSDENWHWYVSNGYGNPVEYIYANGLYSTDSNLAGTLFYGDRYITSGFPVELYAAWGGGVEGKAKNNELEKILSVDDFPTHMRWSRIQNLQPSPDGTKLIMSRQIMGGTTNWYLSGGYYPPVGGTFTLSVGTFGNTFSSFTTAPIPWDATAEYIYNQLLLIPHLQDPRGHGYPYVPYSGNLGGQLHMRFDTPVPQGCWMASHSDNLIPGPFGGGNYSVHNNKFAEMGPDRWFICDYTGANLEEIEFDTEFEVEFNTLPRWSPDSKILHWVGPSADGDPYCRWLNYDVETKDNKSIVLNYEDEPKDAYGYGPLLDVLYSPSSQKIAYIMRKTSSTPAKLIVGKADGTDQEEIYTVSESPGQDDLVMSRNMAWSYDSTKLAIVDERDESPIWVFDLVANTHTKIWPGSGWDNEEEQKWIYELINFNGG